MQPHPGLIENHERNFDMNTHSIIAAPGKPPTAFSMHHAAYLATVATYEAHCAAHEPADKESPLWRDYEASYEQLVAAMFETGVAAIKVPAANAVEVATKLAIIRAQEYWDCGGETMIPIVNALADDAMRFANGGAA
ncbi:hypothetical protein CVO77_03585 [Sphingopyxis lindanitolerans]|uniref:Uncharacterized protein n=1 Tax=Sphingopyxis lindanitolerans TaxID=2054227 RepID=A0A2S8B5K1_9SPHN|nr:hypothetical protein CVO77_03585 [Sphingopyxis lindanitolerans]